MKEKGVSFCGVVIEKTEHGYFIQQRPYTKELLKKHKLEGCNSTKIILDRESDDEDRTFEKEQREEWYQNWVTTEEFRSKVKESQRIAGEILWLTTRTRTDLCFSIQKMSSLATKNPVKSSSIWNQNAKILERYRRLWIKIPHKGRNH